MAVARFRVVSLSAPVVDTLIVTIIMRTSGFFHRYAAGAFVVAVAVGERCSSVGDQRRAGPA
jgi:hypothetical protein